MAGKRGLAVFAAAFVIILTAVSCSQEKIYGPLGVNKIPLTSTPTCTPDVSYTVYIHQEATPAVSVGVSLYSVDKGVTMTAKTGADGKAGFPVHNGGKWSLLVDSFNGFDSQVFAVEPVSNTSYAVNYGIPTLDMELVSGSENIPVSASTIEYKITYHTKFPKFERIFTSVSNNESTFVFNPQTIRKDGDVSVCTLSIVKSFEGYTEADKYFRFIVEGIPTAGDSTYADERTLIKDWYFNISVDFMYMAVYDYPDNGHHTSFYAGIRNTNASLSHNIPFGPQLKYAVLDSGNTGSAGMNTPYNGFLSPPAFTGYGSFQALSKIPTSMGWDYTASHPDNNGWITVRFYDDLYLDVSRTFSTTNGWGVTCADWCCMLGGTPTSDNHTCGTIPPAGACFLSSFAPEHVWRERHETIYVSR